MLEMIAAFCGIVGSISTAMAQGDNENAKKYWLVGAGGFALGNVFLFQVATNHGLSFMALQMVFFAVSAFLMMYVRASKVLALALFGLMTYVVVVNFGVFSHTFKIGNDLIPSVIAVIGAFMLSAKNMDNAVLKGYILFLLADVFYIYIGVVEKMPWFTLQTVVYLFASLYAVYKLMKSMKTQNINNALVQV